MSYHQALGRHRGGGGGGGGGGRRHHHHHPGPTFLPGYPYPGYPGYSPWPDVPVGERIYIVSETDEEREEREAKKKKKKKALSGFTDFIGGSTVLTLGALGLGAWLFLRR